MKKTKKIISIFFMGSFIFLTGLSIMACADEIEWITDGDFLLTISVEETTLRRGEDFVVYAELKNQSGQDQEIVFQWLFMPIIPNWDVFDVYHSGDLIFEMPVLESRFFADNGTIVNIDFMTSEGAISRPFFYMQFILTAVGLQTV